MKKKKSLKGEKSALKVLMNEFLVDIAAVVHMLSLSSA